jgi:glycosyltransferase involved in cell wall biosynthesis
MKKLTCLLLLFTNLYGAEQPTICLNMIVKNETPVITRCLNSVKPIIDYWVIVDTGSTDGTQTMIKEIMKDIPGELYEKPWVNFAQNRNEALEFAKGKGDYILFIDADEELKFTSDFKLPHLDKDFYYIETNLNGMLNYKRVQLVNNTLDWKWQGVIHETLNSPKAKTIATLSGVTNIAKPEGNRSKDPEKFKKDAQLIEKALQEEPENSRYVFYLAQSYRDAGEFDKAIENYEKRILMNGWDQEVFWSLLQIAHLKQASNYDKNEVIISYLLSYTYRPTRKEPLYYLANYYRKQSDFLAAYNTASYGLSLKNPEDILFVEGWITDYGMLLEYSIAAYWTNHYLEAYIASHLLLTQDNLPQNVRETTENNLVWINRKLNEQNQTKMNENNELKRYLEAYLASKLLLADKSTPADFKQKIEKNLNLIRNSYFRVLGFPSPD